MILTKETMDFSQKKGINVRFYPEKTFDEFKNRVYNERVNEVINYYKNHVAGCPSVLNGTANVVFNSFEELNDKAKKTAEREVLKCGRGLSSYDYDTLIIEYEGRYIVKKISTKSKLIDVSYIGKEINKSKKQYSGTYGKIAEKMQKLLFDNNINNNFIIYPTTYGIGVWCIFNWNAEKYISQVTEIMERNGIEYQNEYSDAFWVYRFKISKKQANLAKL